MKTKRSKPSQPGYRHPYVSYEADPLWPVIEKAVRDLVQNRDLVESEDRNYIVGYICKIIRKGESGKGHGFLKDTVASALVARFTKLAATLQELAAPLSEEQFWKKPFAFGNSFGHLVLHLTGNLNYYIGAQIAGTGYVRDRPLEFSNTVRPPKVEVLKKFDEAIEMVVSAIGSQSAEDWSKDYNAVGVDARDRFAAALLCITHLHHHIGQMMYLGFELKRTS